MKTTPSSVQTNSYALLLDTQKITVILAGEEIAYLNPLSALNITNDDDETFTADIEGNNISLTQVGETVYQWTSASSLWEKKIYTLTCYETHFEYAITVYGAGRVDTVNYFLNNNKEGHLLGGSNEFYEGFYPDVPLGDGNGTYPSNKSHSVYSVYTVPPMFYHAFKIAGINTCLSFGLVAEMGEHNFTALSYINEKDYGFGFSTDQYGHVTVDGAWTTPKMVIYTASDYYDAGKKYCDFYFDDKICDRGNPSIKPRFWYGPISCGWIEQSAYSYLHNSNLNYACQESLYTEMLTKLEKKDLHPSILIIDDKWQEEYGTAKPDPQRWPDLRGFIDRTLQKGIHTLMWYQLWNAEGLPEECMTIDEEGNEFLGGNRKVVDPSHPTYRKILREIVHRILSDEEGCYNAFGFKLDFAFCQPHGRKVKTYSGKYGVELLYDYIKQFHTYAKEVKPDAIINASPCHPIFASIVDQARLHDYDSSCRNCKEIFEHRAKLWGTANPYALIDTDGGGFNTHRDMMRFMLHQPNIGIPDLYCVSDLPNFAFTDQEWQTIADVWRAYAKKIDALVK